MAIMISIKPEYCEKILNGEKILEIRKSIPKCDLPQKVYIYCTKPKRWLVDSPFTVFSPEELWIQDNKIYSGKEDSLWNPEFDHHYILNGKVVAEFTLKEYDRYTAEFCDNDCYEDIRLYTENPYAEDIDDIYYEDIIATNDNENPSDCDLCKQSCLSYEKIKEYVGINFHSKPFYAWHIDDLIIYDKPKELGEFTKPTCIPNDKFYFPMQLTRPFQSWGYVDELKEVN